MDGGGRHAQPVGDLTGALVTAPPGPRLRSLAGHVAAFGGPSDRPTLPVTNGTGTLTRLTWDGTNWVAAVAPLTLHYPDGTGTPDSEGVTVAGDGLVYVGTERNNAAMGTSSLQVLRIDPAAGGTATRAWDLTAKIPAVGANTGIEAIEFVPDFGLTGLVDPATGRVYDPNAIPAHGGGLFFVGIEETGLVYVFALHEDRTSTLVATLNPGLSGVMALDWNADTQRLWAMCDDGCQGTSAVFDLADAAAPVPVARPTGMPNLNNEGFALSPVCVDGRRMAVWADDGDTDTRSLRVSHVTCTVPAPTPTPTAPTPTNVPTFALSPTPTGGPTSGPPVGKDSSGGLADTGAPEGLLLGLGALTGGLALLHRR